MSAEEEFAVLYGSPAFAAPEVVLAHQQLGGPYRAAPTDIWSVAATFACLLFGGLPEGMPLQDPSTWDDYQELANYHREQQVAAVELLTSTSCMVVSAKAGQLGTLCVQLAKTAARASTTVLQVHRARLRRMLCGALPSAPAQSTLVLLQAQMTERGVYQDVEDLLARVNHSPECKDWLRWLLAPDPSLRPTAFQALRHPWLAGPV